MQPAAQAGYDALIKVARRGGIIHFSEFAKACGITCEGKDIQPTLLPIMEEIFCYCEQNAIPYVSTLVTRTGVRSSRSTLATFWKWYKKGIYAHRNEDFKSKLTLKLREDVYIHHCNTADHAVC